MNSRLQAALGLGALGLALSGCTSFHQVYHFQSSGAGAQNFYRVTVDGDAQTAKARYVAGFYDERAVDLFFSETKSAPGEEAQLRRIFVDGQKNPGDTSTIKPLSPERANGAFVMIFSTNPKAIADAIGSFSESQVVADAVTNLANQKEVQVSRLLTARVDVDDAQANAISDELSALLPSAGDSTAVLSKTYLRALSAISRASGGPAEFKDFAAARAWLGRAK